MLLLAAFVGVEARRKLTEVPDSQSISAIQIGADRSNGLTLAMQLANVATLIPYSSEF